MAYYMHLASFNEADILPLLVYKVAWGREVGLKVHMHMIL